MVEKLHELKSPITPYQLYNDLDKLVKELKGE